MDMEQDGCIHTISADSWRFTHYSQHQQWLQSALSELDKRTRDMLSMMHQNDDGDTFARRAEMYYQRRPDHIHRLRRLRRSFHSLFSSLAAATTHTILPRRRSSFHGYSNNDPRRSTTTTTTGTEYSRSSSVSSADQEEEVEEGGTLEEVGRIMGELARRNTEKREEKKELEAKVERLEKENVELRKLLEEGVEKKKTVTKHSVIQTQQRARHSVEGTKVDCRVCSGLVRKQRRSSPVQKIKQLIFREQ